MLVHKDNQYKTIAFDYDGVISYTSMVFPKAQALSRMHVLLIRYLAYKGWKCYLNTSRTGDMLEEALSELRAHSCPLELSEKEGKPIAVIYVDDRQVGGLPTIEEILRDCNQKDPTVSLGNFNLFLLDNGYVLSNREWYKSSFYKVLDSGEMILSVPYSGLWIDWRIPSGIEKSPIKTNDWTTGVCNGALMPVCSSGFLHELCGVPLYPLHQCFVMGDDVRDDDSSTIKQLSEDQFVVMFDRAPALPVLREAATYEEALGIAEELETQYSKMEEV